MAPGRGLSLRSSGLGAEALKSRSQSLSSTRATLDLIEHANELGDSFEQVGGPCGPAASSTAIINSQSQTSSQIDRTRRTRIANMSR